MNLANHSTGRLSLPPANETLSNVSSDVEEFMRAGIGAQGAAAMQDVLSRLPSLAPGKVRYERTCDTRAVIDELAPLLATVDVSHVRGRLLSVGLAPEQLSHLRQLLLAFVHLGSTDHPHRALSSTVVERALRLRREIMDACQWNLRGPSEAATLGRISDSTDRWEIALDLTELAELLLRRQARFGSDGSFCAQTRAQEALFLAAALRSEGTEQPMGGPSDLERQVFEALVDCVDQVRAAGRYALRASPQLARAFCEGRALWRRRTKLRAVLEPSG